MNASRRHILILCTALLLTIAGARAETVDILFAGEADSPAYHGARQGLSEANAQGEFLGVSYRLVTADTSQATPRAVVAAVNPARLLRLGEQYPDLPVLNVTASENTLREACERNVFHVIPSRAMLEDAENQWQRKNPGTTARARAWHHTFRKYAASQLNIRYHEQFAQDMNDESWSGWAAVKLLSDTIVRQPAITGPALIEQLQTNLAFDGQKGTDMSFRETGQLRQPLLLVDNGRIVGEAPVRGVVNPNNLDSLGLSFCPK